MENPNWSLSCAAASKSATVDGTLEIKQSGVERAVVHFHENMNFFFLKQRPPDHRKETQTAVVWSCLPFISSGQNHLARHSERGKKTRRTKEEMGRQHQGMDRPGVRQVPKDSGEQGKWRKLVAKSSVVLQRPSQLRDR